MIEYPKKYDELMDKCEKYYVAVWNDDHTKILDFTLDPDAPEEIKKAYEEAKRIFRETEKTMVFLIIGKIHLGDEISPHL